MKYFFMGLSGAFKINERLTLGALDRNQVSDYFAGFSPTGTRTFGEDVVRSLFHNDPACLPSAALVHGIVSSLIRFAKRLAKSLQD